MDKPPHRAFKSDILLLFCACCRQFLIFKPMLSKYLYIPFVVTGIVLLYLTWEVSERFAVYLIPVVLILATIYILSPQIDWWGARKKPPALDEPLLKLLARMPFFFGLSANEKKQFSEKIALFMMAKDWQIRGAETIPEDAKFAVAASALQLSFRDKNYLLDPFEHIVFYPTTFPSPRYPTKWHSSEIEPEDGVAIFSIEHLLKGFFRPRQYFASGLYEAAHMRIHLLGPPSINIEQDFWERIQATGPFYKAYIEQWIGLPEAELNLHAVMLVYYFTFSNAFRQMEPEWAKQIEAWLSSGAKGR